MKHAEMLEVLTSAPNVTVRDTAVISKVLYENLGSSPEELARRIITAQVAAGLITVIQDDLRTYIDDVVTAAIEKDRGERA